MIFDSIFLAKLNPMSVTMVAKIANIKAMLSPLRTAYRSLPRQVRWDDGFWVFERSGVNAFALQVPAMVRAAKREGGNDGEYSCRLEVKMELYGSDFVQ